MFSARAFSALVVLSVALLTAATPTAPKPVTTTITVSPPAPTVTSVGQCNTGDAQCCDSVTTANSNAAGAIFGILGIALGDLTELVGLDCSPITAVGIGGGTCTASPVCCTDNSFGNVISLGCVPITL